MDSWLQVLYEPWLLRFFKFLINDVGSYVLWFSVFFIYGTFVELYDGE